MLAFISIKDLVNLLTAQGCSGDFLPFWFSIHVEFLLSTGYVWLECFFLAAFLLVLLVRVRFEIHIFT